MLITIIIIGVLLTIVSGLSKAIMDLSEEGKLKFKKKSFWIKELSYINKWKNGDKKQGEKFWGSSRWFVMFTDAWHLFGFIQRVTYGVSFTIVGYMAGTFSLYFLFGILINYLVFIAIFHIFHTYKILKK